jgi:hypothetical protein
MKRIALLVVLTLFLAAISGTAMAASMLEIAEVTAKVDSDKQSADENGGTIDVIPNSTLSLKIKINNLYDTAVEGGEIDDITVNGILEEIDDGDDIEQEEDDFDLRQGRDKTFTLEWAIPLRLETDETYKLVLTAEGRDKNGTRHTDEVQFDVDVDKENHKLTFLRKDLSPSKVSCTKSTTVSVGLINIGKEDEDVELTISAPELGYNKVQTFEMSQDIDDDSNEYSFSGTIDNFDVSPGTYTVAIKALYNDDKRSLDDTLTLEVVQCGSTTTTPVVEEEEEEEPVTVMPVTTTVPVTTTPVQTTTPVEVVSQPSSPYIRPTTVVATPKTNYSNSWWDNNKWLVVILGSNLILIVVGIIVISAVLKRRN